MSTKSDIGILPVAQADFTAQIPVVVVGGGACGLTAALAARDGGAETLLLEADPVPQGTTAMSQGAICAAGTKAQAALGIDDTPELFYADVMARTEGRTDPELVRIVTNAAGPAVDWLTERHDIPFTVDTSWRGLGHSRQRLHGPPDRTGTDLSERLARAVEKAGADILSSARAVGLFADSDGRVAGARIARPDGSHEDIGCGALVLATCGFAANPAMVAEHIPGMANVATHTWENASGDGIRWGMALGGAVADMTAFQGYGALAVPQQMLFNYNYIIDGGVMVNRNGLRFSDELADVSGQGMYVHRQPDHLAYMIWDATLQERYKHVHETRQALSLNAIKFADSAEGLARALDLPPAALAATLAEVRAIKEGRKADPFGRKFTGAHQLASPYAGIRVTGALFHTQGGLVVNHDAQVTRPDGALLPNLFAGGGTARGMSGPTMSGYIPAAGICMAITLGRLAGTAAAKMAG